MCLINNRNSPHVPSGERGYPIFLSQVLCRDRGTQSLVSCPFQGEGYPSLVPGPFQGEAYPFSDSMSLLGKVPLDRIWLSLEQDRGTPRQDWATPGNGKD